MSATKKQKQGVYSCGSKKDSWRKLCFNWSLGNKEGISEEVIPSGGRSNGPMFGQERETSAELGHSQWDENYWR